jgi:DNA repair exonuclease SbcCD ATPase subunit
LIKIKKVKLTNFLSYGAVPTEVNFEEPGTTLMVGKNGVGKTSIINALVYGLYDKPISSGINKDDLVNNINKRRMEVVVEFDIGKQPYKVIRARKMKTGPTGNYVKIYEGKKDITPDSVYNANDLLKEIIGIDYELFVRIVTFAATHEPFLDLPVHSSVKANQTDIIEELFDLKTLSDKADLLKEKIKDNERSLKTAENEIEFKKKSKENYDNQIKSAQLRIDQWNKTSFDLINAFKKKLAGLLKIDVKAQRALLESINESESLLEQEQLAQKEIETESTRKKEDKESADTQLRSSLKRFNKWKTTTETELDTILGKIAKVEEVDIDEQQTIYEEISTMESQVDDTKDDRTEFKRNLKTKEKTIEKKIAEREHLKDDKCPYCHQSFADAAEKLKELEECIKETEKEIKTLISDIKKCDKTIKSEEAKIATRKKKVKVDDISELIEIRSQMDHLKERLDELQHAKNPHDAELEEKRKLVEDRDYDADEYATKIKSKKNEIEEIKEKITDESDKLFVTSMENLFDTKKSIETTESTIREKESEINPHIEAMDELKKNKPKKVNMKKINNINTEIEHQRFLHKILTKKDSFVRKALLDRNIPYLNKQLSFYLNELELPFAVEFTHEMTARITSFGNEISFANMSAGQKSRINLALSFAFRDVLQNLNDKINVCMMDEVLDVGLDTEGVQIATTMLKNRAMAEGLSMFVISHKSEEIDAFEKRMHIKFNKGFSEIHYS